ncbi:hypothetical protein ACFX1S_046443 [Malus domestica]
MSRRNCVRESAKAWSIAAVMREGKAATQASNEARRDSKAASQVAADWRVCTEGNPGIDMGDTIVRTQISNPNSNLNYCT